MMPDLLLGSRKFWLGGHSWSTISYKCCGLCGMKPRRRTVFFAMSPPILPLV